MSLVSAPADPEGPPPVVSLHVDALVIRELRVSDPEVLAAARRQTAAQPQLDLADWLVGRLSLGCRALTMASGAVDDSAIGLRLDGLAARVDATAQSAAARVEAAVLAATDPERGAVARAVQEALGRLSADVSELVAGEDGPLRAAVDGALGRVTRGVLDEIGRALAAQTSAVRSALSADDPAGPFAALRREMRASSEQTRAELARQIGDVRALVEAARARDDVLSRTSQHQGASYEEATTAAVTEVAGALGDAVEATGHQVGLSPGCKVGDCVASVADRTTGGRPVSVVVEAKSASLSSKRWKAELVEAKANRGAHGAVGVVNGVERMPGRARRVFVIDPATVLVAWQPGEPVDLLAAVYQLARAAAVAEEQRQSGAEEHDAAALTAALAEAYAALDRFDALLRAEAAGRRALDDVGRAARELRATLEGIIGRALGWGERRGA